MFINPTVNMSLALFVNRNSRLISKLFPLILHFAIYFGVFSLPLLTGQVVCFLLRSLSVLERHLYLSNPA